MHKAIAAAAAALVAIYPVVSDAGGGGYRKTPWPKANGTEEFRPSYPVHIIPDFVDAHGQPIFKGKVASTNVREICAGKGAYRNVARGADGKTYSQENRTSQNPETKRLVLQQSGVPERDAAYYEDDHYGPLALGFSNSIENRWAQPRFGIWSAAKKDAIETYYADAVCNKKIDLAEAQALFQTKITPDWRSVYCRLSQRGLLKEFAHDPACNNPDPPFIVKH